MARSFTVPQTANNSWDTYRVMKGNISRILEAGEHILRITITGANCNIDKIELKCTENTPVVPLLAEPPTLQPMYNLGGQKVGTNYRGIVIQNGRKVLKR